MKIFTKFNFVVFTLVASLIFSHSNIFYSENALTKDKLLINNEKSKNIDENRVISEKNSAFQNVSNKRQRDLPELPKEENKDEPYEVEIRRISKTKDLSLLSKFLYVHKLIESLLVKISLDKINLLSEYSLTCLIRSLVFNFSDSSPPNTFFNKYQSST